MIITKLVIKERGQQATIEATFGEGMNKYTVVSSGDTTIAALLALFNHLETFGYLVDARK